jgi:hypothetical protein
LESGSEYLKTVASRHFADHVVVEAISAAKARGEGRALAVTRSAAAAAFAAAKLTNLGYEVSLKKCGGSGEDMRDAYAEYLVSVSWVQEPKEDRS